MLVLSRKPGEVLRIADTVLTVLEIRGNKVRVGIQAPDGVPVHREEVHRRLHGESVAVQLSDSGPRP